MAAGSPSITSHVTTVRRVSFLVRDETPALRRSAAVLRRAGMFSGSAATFSATALLSAAEVRARRLAASDAASSPGPFTFSNIYGRSSFAASLTGSAMRTRSGDDPTGEDLTVVDLASRAADCLM